MVSLALAAARAGMERQEVPVGAVIWLNGTVIATRHNEREERQDPTAHAEILVLRDAAEHMKSWRLPGAVVAVTLEPCIMCAGALQQARVARVVFGAYDTQAGALGSIYNIGSDPRLNHQIEVVSGVLADECGALLKSYFKTNHRNKGKRHN